MGTLLEVVGLWKKYSRDLSSSRRHAAREFLKIAPVSDLKTELQSNEFWALQNISFSLQRGEVLAVLGHNGAGKSTLLKCITGKLRADRGEVETRGNIGHMLEMSAGFSPSLSGRDNVSIRGRLMGFSGKSLATYISRVKEFAEIDDFFDSPVQFYSSGMKARLGFAVSSSVDPDILILDEVLSVGDLAFRMKCYSRIDELRKKCATILVTHSMNHVSRMANSVILLRKGKLIFQGPPQKGLELYQDEMGKKNAKPMSFNDELINFEVKTSKEFLSQDTQIKFGENISIKGYAEALSLYSLSLVLHEQGGSALIEWNSLRSGFKFDGNSSFYINIGALNLSPGYYHFAITGFGRSGDVLFLSKPFNFRIVGDYLSAIRVQPLAIWDSNNFQ